MRRFSFEKLEVWMKVRRLTLLVYKTTSSFPALENFGLTSQIRRCSISIASNIAEGSGRHTPKDKSRFTVIAYGSALELLNLIIISHDLGLISEEDQRTFRSRISEITAMLNALLKSQRNSSTSKPLNL